MSWRAALPRHAERRLAVRVTADALRQIRGGSPWLFDGAITSVSGGSSGDGGGAPGDLAVVFDADRRFAAIGLWDPTSPIRIKVLRAGTPTAIDEVFWRTVISAALDRRAGLQADSSTTGYRCVHGENDGLPGLIVDRYADTLAVKLYTAAWFPHLAAVVDSVVAETAARRVVLRLARSVAPPALELADGATLVGAPPDGPVVFRERGLTLEADVVRGQKTGFFLDQRDNRALVQAAAEGRDVLDVFASTGGFALAAAAGGARSVHLVDSAELAIATARRNFAHNQSLAAVRRCHVRVTVGDAFEVLADLAKEAGADRSREAGRYDVVVIDPPSFASNQAGVERAVRAYATLARLGVSVLRRGGLLVQASCSSRVDADAFVEAVHAGAARAGRPLRELRRTGHALDHPIGFPQGAYLKALFAEAP